jgi:hypothetical protein
VGPVRRFEMMCIKFQSSQAQWLTPVIPVTQDAKIQRMAVRG